MKHMLQASQLILCMEVEILDSAKANELPHLPKSFVKLVQYNR